MSAMPCGACGTALPADSRFCSACGSEQVAVEASGSIAVHCSECGAVCPANSKYCPSCGVAFGRSAANFGQRVGVYLLDSLLVFIPSMIVLLVISAATWPEFFQTNNGNTNAPASWIILLGLCEFALGYCYFGFCWTRGGRTPGMKVASIQVQRRDGSPLGWDTGLAGSLCLASACGAWGSAYSGYSGTQSSGAGTILPLAPTS
jgi:RNA polymerase subunit RPABC4/transcription elongation factor Spt4